MTGATITLARGDVQFTNNLGEPAGFIANYASFYGGAVSVPDAVWDDGARQFEVTFSDLFDPGSGPQANADAAVTIESITLIAAALNGDYNNDGVVDAADFTVWRDNLGAPAGTLPNDPNGSAIGADQYATWVANFGAAAAAAAAVPEPSGVAMSVLLGIGVLRRARVRA